MEIGSLLIDAIVELVQPILDFITNHTDTIMELVFNYNVVKDTSTGQVISSGVTSNLYGLFTTEELKTLIQPGVNGLMKICSLLLLLGLIYYGVRLSRQGANERLRSENMSMLFTLFFSMFILNNIWTLYDMMFLFNNIIVNTFRSMAFSKLGGADFTSGAEDSSSAILGLVLSIIMVGLSVWANFFYIMRKLMIILLMITGPVFITLSIYPQMRQVTSTWGRELFSNIISQGIHAMMLWIFIVMSNSTTGWLVQIVFLATFIPISEAIKGLLGASGDTGKMAMGSSLSALAGAAALSGNIANAVGSNNISSLLSKFGGSSNAAGSSAGSSAGRGGGGRIGSGYSPAESSYSESSAGAGTHRLSPSALTNSRSMNRALKAGRVLGRIGATAGGLLGATAMAPLGPAGMALGASIGSSTLSSAGELTGRAAGQIASSVGSEVYNGFKPGGAITQAGQGRSGAGRKAAQVATMFASLGKGAAKGIGIHGGIENSLRGVASNAAGVVFGEKGYNNTYAVADAALGFATKPRMGDLKSKHDNKELRGMRVVQTNDGTYLTGRVGKGKDSKRERISRIGDSNPALKTGESIEIDATFTKGGRLHIDESSMRFKDISGQVRQYSGKNGKDINDNAYARSKYTKIEATDFFKESYPEVCGKRSQRDNHSKWLQKNAYGGRR